MSSTYTPNAQNKVILHEALEAVQSVPYAVTARWVFYRLLQAGLYSEKAGYKHLLGLLSRARKSFYEGWAPDTLADESRAAQVRGAGWHTPEGWKQAVRRMTCGLDKWAGQPVYVECWFEAAAMEQQFAYHTHPYIPLLAFHGDVSIPEKWKAAERLAKRWEELHVPIVIYYYGDNDPKGLTIPQSAWTDVEEWAGDMTEWAIDASFRRVGLNPGDEGRLGIQENPERPGTYQWEALEDDQAQDLISRSSEDLDLEAFEDIEGRQDEATAAFRVHLDDLTL